MTWNKLESVTLSKDAKMQKMIQIITNEIHSVVFLIMHKMHIISEALEHIQICYHNSIVHL